MTDDEIRDYLRERFLSHHPAHVMAFREGLELGKQAIKDKVAQRFKIANCEWNEERS
jgi:hypothetical protein